MSATAASAGAARSSGVLPGPLETFGVPLATFTTLRVGGPARRLVTATTTDAVIDAVSECVGRREPVLVLSGGSNLLVADDGFDGTVVRIATRGVSPEHTSACGGVTGV